MVISACLLSAGVEDFPLRLSRSFELTEVAVGVLWSNFSGEHARHVFRRRVCRRSHFDAAGASISLISMLILAIAILSLPLCLCFASSLPLSFFSFPIPSGPSGGTSDKISAPPRPPGATVMPRVHRHRREAERGKRMLGEDFPAGIFTKFMSVEKVDRDRRDSRIQDRCTYIPT